jgi:hypothetical protein
MRKSNVYEDEKESLKESINFFKDIEINESLINYGMFKDMHHFLGVLYEEHTEVQDNNKKIVECFDSLRDLIFKEDYKSYNLIVELYKKYLIDGIFEMIQVYAILCKNDKITGRINKKE